jgi:ABC-2 type transport system ATP-binding protein
MSTTPAIAVENLVKRYGRTTAVDGVSFTVSPGEFVGLVGPNGAGKSTTIRILTGQLLPTEGRVQIDGIDVVARPAEVRAHIGLVPEEPTLYEYLSAREMLAFAIELRGCGDLDWGLELTGLGADADRLIREYSQGMRRKTALACALVARPPVIVLDEALNGLDPASVARVLGVIDELRQDGAAILLSTHVLDTLEKVASRIVLMQDGRITADVGIDSLAEVRSRLAVQR